MVISSGNTLRLDTEKEYQMGEGQQLKKLCGLILYHPDTPIYNTFDLPMTYKIVSLQLISIVTLKGIKGIVGLVPNLETVKETMELYEIHF